MRKFLISVAACLTMGTFGLVATSCDDDTISQIIEIVSSLMQQGQVYNYNSTGYVQRWNKNANSDKYAIVGEKQQFSCPLSVVVNNDKAQITLPDISVDGVTISTVTFSELALGAVEDKYNTISVADTGVGMSQCTVTVDGNPAAITSLYLENTKLTAETLEIGLLRIAIGDNNDCLINLTDIRGAVATAN